MSRKGLTPLVVVLLKGSNKKQRIHVTPFAARSPFSKMFSGTQEVMHFMLPATTAICLAAIEGGLGGSQEW